MFLQIPAKAVHLRARQAENAEAWGTEIIFPEILSYAGTAKTKAGIFLNIRAFCSVHSFKYLNTIYPELFLFSINNPVNPLILEICDRRKSL
jgi:hypothetical protein